jgi:rare lipoprotein A
LITVPIAGCGGHKRPTTKPQKGRYVETGVASWYGKPFHGRKTASGERYDMHKMTAAHKTLPFGAKVKVTDLGTGRSIQVRINDRGPFVKGRIIDLSKKAAKELGIYERGTAQVRIVSLN